MARAGLTAGERPAVAVGAKPLFDYRQVADRVARLAGALQALLRPGEPVALALRNCPEYLEILYACWHAGLVAVPINAKLHRSEFAYILNNCETRLCFATADLASELSRLQAGALQSVVDISGSDYRRMLAAEPIRLATITPESPAWLFYTSGTTGKPKGATLSHRNLLAMCWCYFADVDQQSPWTAILHAAPMSHGSGLYALPHVLQASCHVIPESGGFDATEIRRLIASWPNLVFFAAPTMVKRLVNDRTDMDTSNLKTIIYGGGPMYTSDAVAAMERYGPKLAQLYGQGESPMTITALSARVHAEIDHPRWRERLASVGIPQSAVEVRTVDDQGQPLAAGEIGEIVVRGETVMNGYWLDPQATERTIRNGWLHTGDVGCFDADGFLTLKDRAKDVIISGGTNIYAREVEDVLTRHHSVAEAAVVGRADPDWGETVVAYVVPTTGKMADPESLDRFCIDHIARFKRPRHDVRIDSLPKNNDGKVLKTALRDRLAADGESRSSEPVG